MVRKGFEGCYIDDGRVDGYANDNSNVLAEWGNDNWEDESIVTRFLIEDNIEELYGFCFCMIGKIVL